MIDVEQDGVGAFEEDLLAGLAGLDQDRRGIIDEGLYALAVLAVLLEELLGFEAGQAVEVVEDGACGRRRPGRA